MDLWPNDIADRYPAGGSAADGTAAEVGTRGTLRSPVVILHEQAALLGEKTGEVVQGQVVKGKGLPPGEAGEMMFVYELGITAPALPGYVCPLVTIVHGRAFYPVDVFVAEEVMEELVACVPALGTDPRWEVFGEMKYVHAFTEEAFQEVLRIVLGAYATRQVVAALLSQVEEGEEEEVPF